MSSRTFLRSAALVLAVSAGAFFIPGAEAAQPRGRTGSVLLEELSLRPLLRSLTDLLRGLAVTKGDPAPPNNPPPNDPPVGPSNKEGTAGCPVGPPNGLRAGQ
jgi:hypothetical protein